MRIKNKITYQYLNLFFIILELTIMSEDKYPINTEIDNQPFFFDNSPNNYIDEDNLFEINFNENIIGEEVDSIIKNKNKYNQNFENIDGDQNYSFIHKNDFRIVQNEAENKNEDKKIEILISSKEEDKEKNSTKEEEKKNVQKKVNFETLKLTGKKRKIKYKENIYEYFYDKDQFKHSKLSLDNIRKKIINHFLKFLISLLNAILRKNNYYEKNFYNLSKKEKIFANASNKNINQLKNKTIKEILSFEISSKCKCYKVDKKGNEKIYKEFLEKFPLMESLFQKKFIDIFNEIYCNKNKIVNKGIIDLNIFNINLIIDLNKEKLETYESLIEKSKNKCKNKKEYDDYIKKIKVFVETKNL